MFKYQANGPDIISSYQRFVSDEGIQVKREYQLMCDTVSAPILYHHGIFQSSFDTD